MRRVEGFILPNVCRKPRQGVPICLSESAYKRIASPLQKPHHGKFCRRFRHPADPVTFRFRSGGSNAFTH
jgi:hypothetical protein